jgi:hypothetical protein
MYTRQEAENYRLIVRKKLDELSQLENKLSKIIESMESLSIDIIDDSIELIESIKLDIEKLEL